MDAFERGHARALFYRDSRVSPSVQESKSAYRSGAAVLGHVAPGCGTVSPIDSPAYSGAKLHRPRISCKGQLPGEFSQLCGLASRGIAVCENTVSDLRFRGVFLWYFPRGNDRGTTVHDRRLEIRWIHKPQELSSCQILFVSRSEQKRYNQALDVVRGRMVLTVGETPEFLAAAGFELLQQQGAIQFDVNLEAANKARLKISSRLLALARHIVNDAEAAKS